MKYTVIMHAPVPDERRAELEDLLMSGLGVSAGAADKLASRRSGRLLKPTTQAKAEQLYDIFHSVDAAVELAEVPEEGGAATQSAAPESDTLVIKAAAPSDDPFGVPAAGLAGDPFADPFAVIDPAAEESAAGSSVATETAEDDPWADFTSGLGAEFSDASAEDDPWADFAQELQIDVPEMPLEDERPAPLVGTFMDLEAAAQPVQQKGPRQTLTQQFSVGMLLPIGVTALLVLGAVAILTPPSARLRVLIPVLLLLLLGGAGSYIWATNLVRELLVKPLGRLLDAARAISEGNLDQPVRTEDNNEIGDLADALNRMRVSLDAAMSRLRRKR